MSTEKQRAYDRKRYHEKLKHDPNYKARAKKRSAKRTHTRISIHKLCLDCQAKFYALSLIKNKKK